MPTDPNIHLQVVGASFIALYSYHRFNTPYTNRSSTTALRYHLGAAVYALLIVSVYLVLSHIQLSERVEGLLSSSQEGLLRDPLLLALLLTVLLPQAPWLASLDNWLREKCKRLAAIPYEVRRLSAELRRAPFEPSADIRAAVRHRLLERGFEEEEVRLEEGEGPQGLWLKATALMVELQQWESEPRFAGFLNRFSDDWQGLRSEFNGLVPKAKRCFQLLGDAASAPSDATVVKMAAEYRSNLMNEVRRLLAELYEFISRGVLQCQLTRATRLQQLSKLGFQRSHQPTLSRDSLVAVFLMVVPVIGASLLVGQKDFTTALTRAPQYALTYVVAVICALWARHLKRPAVGEDPLWAHRPWFAYLVAGVVAVAGSAVINLGSKFLLYPSRFDLDVYWERGFPWVLLSFVTAFVTAFHLDNRPSERFPFRRLRWIEGATQGILTVVAAVGVCLWLSQYRPAEDIPWHVLGSAGLIGLLLGITVPSWFRMTEALELEDEERALMEPILAPAKG